MRHSLQIPKTSEKFFRCKLSLLIGFVFCTLLIILGLIITLYSFETQKQRTLETTEKVFELSSQYTEEKLAGLIDTVKSFVTVSSALQSLGATRVEKLPALLPYLKQSFTTIPWMDSFYVGYGDGSFYMVQAIRDRAHIRKKTEAPKEAAYSIKIIPPATTVDRQVEFSYFDQELNLLQKRKEDIQGYDPREREWYREAIQTDETVITEPYLFFSTREVGITTAHLLREGNGVVGADSVLSALAKILSEQKLTPSTQIVLLDARGRVILSAEEADISRIQELSRKNKEGTLHVKDLHNQSIKILYEKSLAAQAAGGQVIEVNGKEWFGHMRLITDEISNGMYIAISSPFDELLVDALASRKRSLEIVLSIVIAALVLGIYFSHRITESLRKLSLQAEAIRNFKLAKPLTVQSRICEVDQLASSMTVMQGAINRFVEIARALSAEKKMEKVLEMIVTEAGSVAGADGGGIGLVSDDGKTFSHVLVHNGRSGVHFIDDTVPLERIAFTEDGSEEQSLEEKVIRSGQTQVIDDLTEDIIPVLQLHEQGDYSCHSLLLIPLLNRQEEVIGLLHLVNARDENGAITNFSPEKISYIKALASNAALALDNNRLIRAQKDLFDSFVRLIAGAIDTKSPYTGGHCQRVPVLAGMLAEAASSSNTPPFHDFELSEDERYELFVASWLHDCGKVTTPEYVVDKATKLETIYNRIHEIRTRFEVLWRDVDIAFYKSILENPEQQDSLQEEREKRQQELQEDFSFIAECNVGGEFMAPEKIARLQQIASRIWLRNFDNRLGLSGDEEARMDMAVGDSLPVSESLLADKEEHIFPRTDAGTPYGENPWDITMKVPDHRYNQGEIYNLSIARGTLTDEERYKINDHIVQTIEMLNTLPFPKEIRRVPDWAGNHHEKLDGSGYPRSLTAEQLTIPERIMAVADIFEALTAADRPYKTPKTLSNCIKIMSFMRNDGHICPDLFELFLRSGLYLEYAREYMQPEQIDDVNIEDYLRETA